LPDTTGSIDTTGTSGIEIVKNNTVSIYPNPTNGILHVGLPQNYQGNIVASIIDLTGRTIYKNRMANGNFTINTTSWSKGLYLLQLNNNGKLENYKVLVE
jgi:hypothetical protein